MGIWTLCRGVATSPIHIPPGASCADLARGGIVFPGGIDRRSFRSPARRVASLEVLGASVLVPALGYAVGILFPICGMV
jgi:hypothetical protein